MGAVTLLWWISLFSSRWCHKEEGKIVIKKSDTEGSLVNFKAILPTLIIYESKRNFCLFSVLFYRDNWRVYDDGSMAGSSFNFTFFASIETWKSNCYLKWSWKKLFLESSLDYCKSCAERYQTWSTKIKTSRRPINELCNNF